MVIFMVIYFHKTSQLLSRLITTNRLTLQNDLNDDIHKNGEEYVLIFPLSYIIFAVVNTTPVSVIQIKLTAVLRLKSYGNTYRVDIFTAGVTSS
jgi:hypothetical protein